jgi:hypothetical protein
MTATGELIAALVAGGMDAAEAASLVVRAAVEMTATVNHRSPNAVRQQRFRDREKKRNEALLSVTDVTLSETVDRNEALRHNADDGAECGAEPLRTVTNRYEVTLRNADDEHPSASAVTDSVTAPVAKGFSLSPVPLLPPTPPNNPLTPKPSSKNSFGARDFGDWPDDFDAVFWTAWPHKVGKPMAMKALDRVRRRGIPFAAVMDGLGRYVRGKPADRSWMNPATFLNGDRWEDQPASEKNGQTANNYRADPCPGRATGREALQLAAMGRGAARRLEERAAAGCDGEASDGSGATEVFDFRSRSEIAH